MSRPQLSIDSLPAWAHLNEISFFDVHVASTDGSGLGLVALRELATTEQTFDIPALLRIPHYVVLNAAAVEEYAKQDRDFRLLIDAAGHQVNINPLSFIKADLIISADLLYKSSRGDILIFLLVHLILGTQPDATAAGLPGPWTEYIKFLPGQVPLPTLWTEDERLLLQGTSLEHAVQAKLLILEQEFDRLRETSSDIPCWQARLWDTRAAQLKDWRLVDAWYRSRCLELPLSGEAMVPCLDMANHSSTPNAYYEEKSQGEVTLLLRPNQSVRSGDEITISYGEQKSAAEMLFSYGFIDRDSVSRSLVLPLDPFDDDPLAKAKTHLFGEKPTVRVAIVGGDLRWESPFAYLMCVNEEDGLAFRVLQDTDGNRQLKLFWQHEDVTNSARSFDKLTKAHRLSALFELRVVTVVEELLGSQLARLQVQGAAPLSSVDPDASQGATGSIREECHRQAALLRELEAGILSRALEELEEQKSQLLADDNVVAYLGSMEATESGLAPEGASNEDDDFS